MLLKVLGALLLVLFLYVLWKALVRHYRSRWMPWTGAGWILRYDPESKQVTVSTYLLESPAGRAQIQRGSVLVSRNGEYADFESGDAFRAWVASWGKPVVGTEVIYQLLEPTGTGTWEKRIVTLRYEELHGSIPQYAPLPTSQEMHEDWRFLMPEFKAVYPTYTCRRTGVTYHRRKVIPVDL